MEKAIGPEQDERERGSEAQRRTLEPRYLVVGEVIGAHGIQGELRVRILTDDPHRFDRLERVFVGLEDEEPVAYILQGHRLHKNLVLLKLGGCPDRTAAERFSGLLIQVPREEAIPLEEGEYFEHQVVGLSVWTVDGSHLGTIEEILYTSAHEIYVVRNPGAAQREILIPAIDGVVLDVDLDSGRLTVDLPEGLT